MGKFLYRSIRVLVVVGILLGVGCANVPPDGQRARDQVTHLIPVARTVESCRNTVRDATQRSGQALPSSAIKMLLWNVFKEQRAHWDDDWSTLARDKHLVLIQEAVHGSRSAGAQGNLSHWAFAPGYQKEGQVTGVATGSQVPPLTQCHLSDLEPWLRTPKASLITQYRLTDSEQRLLVANVHSINFSIGVAAFAKQLKQIKEVLARHRGPIILAGDFNTWNPRREAILDRLAQGLRLEPAEFAIDKRRTVFNRPVSHIYTRGLKLNNSTTLAVTTSDHNPIVAEFSVEL